METDLRTGEGEPRKRRSIERMAVVTLLGVMLWIGMSGWRTHLLAEGMREALVREDVAAVRRLVQQGAPLDARPACGFSALQVAAGGNDLALVHELIQRGAGVNDGDALNITPLMAAAMGGHAAVVGALLESGAEVDAESSTGLTALIWAVPGGHLGVMEHLLRHGADANVDGSRYGETPLLVAVSRDDLPAARMLLKVGARVNQPGLRGDTPRGEAVSGAMRALLRGAPGGP